MSLDRRSFLNVCTNLGFASTLFPGALYSFSAAAEYPRITAEMVDAAAVIAGIPVAPDQKAALITALNGNRKAFEDFRALKLKNSMPPAFNFNPLPSGEYPEPPPPGTDLRTPLHMSPAPAIKGKDVPGDLNELAFATVRELGELVRRRKVSSLALTRMYLARLKKYIPRCISSSTSPRSVHWRRPQPPTRRSRQGSIVASCTGCPGGQRICWR